ncbi:MAG: NUDIX hydrolase [Lachnospiraceae bacterium]|nr:NUDIX hydrolase [Lachnospiraceae bacterium]
MNTLHIAIENLNAAIKQQSIDPKKGLPVELFNFATSLIPFSNVDLFITDNNHRLLLSWRNDDLFGKGWHIPGGCVRMHETLDYRIQQTAINEIGCKVTYDPNDYKVMEWHGTNPMLSDKDQLIRSHSISILYYCTLKSEIITITEKQEPQSGQLRWFDHCPEDLLDRHKEIYGDLIKGYFGDL